MRKQIKIVAVAATSILILVGTTFYVIEKNKEIMDPITIVETDGTIYEIDMISDAKSISDGIDYYMETVEKPISIETEIPTNPINTEVIRVIEEDEDTGSITIENTEGDVVVTNDEALAIAESNAEAEDILSDALADIITEDYSTVTGVDEAYKKEVNTKNDLEEAYSPKNITASSKKNDDVDIDEQTRALFEEMGWGEPTYDHSRGNVIPEGVRLEDIETSVMPYEGVGNPFRTP